MIEIEKDNPEIQKWKPRDVILNNNDSYSPDSPEHVLVEFFTFWTRKNYGGMKKLLPPKTFEAKEAPVRVREHYSHKILKSFKIVSIVDDAPAKTTIKVRLMVEEYGKIKDT